MFVIKHYVLDGAINFSKETNNRTCFSEVRISTMVCDISLCNPSYTLSQLWKDIRATGESSESFFNEVYKTNA
jgi:hypothetical protein